MSLHSFVNESKALDRALIVSLVFACSSMSAATLADGETDPRILLASPDVSVTTEDFDRYVTFRIPEERREIALSREGSVRQAVESVYLVRRFARMAEDALPEGELTQADWEADYYRDRKLMNAYIDAQVAEQIEQSDFDALAQEEYRANPSRYVMPERRKASHILISTDGRTEDEALARATAALERLRGGADFAEVAAEYSDDASVEQNGGDLGFFARGAMVKPFEEAAFAMDSGELSEPVRTQFGFHLIKVQDIIPEEVQPFDSVKGPIIVKLRQERAKVLRQNLIDEMRATGAEQGVIANAPVISELEQKYETDRGLDPSAE